MYIIRKIKSLTKFELALWVISLLGVTLSSVLSPAFNPLSLTASAIGVTALIFVAKGEPIGQILTVVFSVLYGVISFSFRYYGEMLTYLGMSAPMAVLAVVAWVKNPYERGKSEVRVNHIGHREAALMFVSSAVVTGAFYFILKYLNTANLIPSTISVTTSFLASYLTFRRSSFYALAYAANDIVLIVLWVLAAIEDPAYLPMILCFVMFFLNDLYGFTSWRRMQARQTERIPER